jgi:prepilin-type N-terminal cleavage/methylation domain-containing protein
MSGFVHLLGVERGPKSRLRAICFLGKCGNLMLARLAKGASLIELLVVISIMGIMMGLLLPALHRARLRAEETVCDNNVRQLQMALSQFIGTKEKFPAPNYWPVALLPWIEQRPLADIMKGGYSLGAEFPRPPLMQCPFQDEFDSRFPGVRISHYLLVVDRDENGIPREPLMWTIGDREPLDDDFLQEPWYVGPEISHELRGKMIEAEVGPHPGGRFDTERAYWK